MSRRGLLAAGLAAAAVGWAVSAQEKGKPPPEPPKPAPEAAAPDLKPLTAAFLAAFDAGDAAGVAALWTAEAELVTAGGEVVRGREAIKAAYAAVFKARPKVKAAVESGSVRALGPTVAAADGVLRLTDPGDPDPDVTLFSAVVVREADGWRFASVRSYAADPDPARLEDLGWLVGEWAGKAEDGAEVRAAYAWQEGRKFLRGTYAATRDGKPMGGTQVIGADPGGGVRGWLFDDTGAAGESEWERDGSRWVIRSSGKLPDGTAVESTSVLVPLGKDAFTWQAVERRTDGKPDPAGRPVKMTRVAAK
jgi:uncharacterized protein (TIGR02246 family)